uniref:Uncharacterized protein n=1 Tax=Rhizophora mucronata TaxID=61149 RepID=A0A2P2QKL7_RHIMU
MCMNNCKQHHELQICLHDHGVRTL